MDRREFIGAVASGLLGIPLAAEAQRAGRVWRIGYLGNTSPSASPESNRLPEIFRQPLRELGYVEGKNIVVESRWAEGHVERYPALAAEMLRLKVDVIVVGNGPGVRAMKDVTATIPIVMSGVSDPVGAGLVASLARPGGNVTGVADYQLDLVPKRLELVKAAVPRVARVVNLRGNFSGFDAAKLAATTNEQDAAAQALGVTLLRVEMNTPQDFDIATATVVRAHPDALLLSPNPTNLILRRELAAFASRQRLPSMAGAREHALAGTLMSYGPSLADGFRKVATFVDRILKGANPADLPVEQPTKFELVINLRSAKALGLTIPRSVLLRADEVIQ